MGQWDGGNWGQQPPPQNWDQPPQGGQPPLPPGNWHEPPPGGWNDPRSTAGRLRPMTLADVLDGMFRMFLAHWRTYIVALGVVLVPINFVLALIGGIAGANVSMWDQFVDPTTAQAAFQNGPELIALFSLVAMTALSAIFATPFVTGVACRIAADVFNGGNPAPGDVLRSTLPRYWTLVGATLLMALIGIGVVVVPGVVIGVGAATEATPVIVLGVVLLLGAFVALVWLLNRYQLAYAVIVIERVGPAAALRRSAQLVKGRWWRVLGTMALAAIVGGIVGQIVSFPFALPAGFVGGIVGVVLVTIGTVIGTIITTPLTANAETLLYFDGRIRSEGYDLELMTQAVGAGPSNLSPPTGPALG